MDYQRLRNLTTGKLHTEMSHIYEDLELITGEKGIMTHMLPRIMTVIKPWLQKNITNSRFWDSKFDTTHIGEFNLPNPTKKEQELFIKEYVSLPSPF